MTENTMATRPHVTRPYHKLLRALPDEVGLVFDASVENIDALAEAMEWTPRQVHSALLMMERHGLVMATRNLAGRVSRWSLTPEGKKSARMPMAPPEEPKGRRKQVSWPFTP